MSITGVRPPGRSATVAAAALFALVVGGTLTAQTTPSFPSARAAALGGPHVAGADDLGVLFANPAGFRSAGPELSVAEVNVNVAGPIFDTASVIIAAASSDPEEILQSPNVLSLLSNFNAIANIGGPIAFAFVGDGLGFGLYNTSRIVLNGVGAIPNITAAISEDIMFLGGYAVRIPFGEDSIHALDIGASLKAFVTGSVEVERSVLDLAMNFDLDESIILDEPFTLDVGVGFDLGIHYQIGDVLSFGLVGRDLYTPINSSSFATTQDFLDSVPATSTATPVAPINVAAGMQWSPDMGVQQAFSDLNVLLTYDDIFDFWTNPTEATNPILHVGLGVEIVMLEALALRAGFNQGLFAAGLGLDLSVFQLNLSMFGTEQSAQPGLAPLYNVLLGLGFSF